MIYPAIKNSMLATVVSYYAGVYLVDNTNGGVTLNQEIVTPPAVVSGGIKTLTWGSPSNGLVSTTNSAFSNPINYSVPANRTPKILALVDSGDVVRATMPLNTPLPTFVGGDGAYYVRGLQIAITEE